MSLRAVQHRPPRPRLCGRRRCRSRHRPAWTAQASNNAAPSRFRSTMSTARDITHTGATCVGEHKTLTAAAQHMGELGMGALPIPPAAHHRQSSPGRHRQRSRHRSPSDRTCHRAVRQSDLRHPSHRQPLIPRQLGDGVTNTDDEAGSAAGEYSVEDDNQLQPEDTLIDRGIDDMLDEGYSPPERPYGRGAFGPVRKHGPDARGGRAGSGVANQRPAR